MLEFLLKIRYIIEYFFALFVYMLLKIQPHCVIKGLAGATGRFFYCVPALHKMIDANIATCFTEKTDAEIRRIGRLSVVNAARNILEFFWMSNNLRRIKRCLEFDPESKIVLGDCMTNDERIVFVNPHLGSWEASALSVPFFCQDKIAAVANPLRNPYLNKFFNSGNRKQVPGFEVIFSSGAVRASLKALRRGFNIGILIDQNTKVREGGIFVNFFDLPVPCSKSPAEFYRICSQEGMKVRVFFGITLRGDDDKLHTKCVALSKPENEYEMQEMIQELISTTEDYIRKYPEQYIWLYKRFAHIPRGLDEDRVKRYPYYARLVKESFYSKVKRVNVSDYLPD
jgi:KDO2-lipid IV(A) lauroyltransferase